MILFFSGGGTPWVPERVLQDPKVMLSYHSMTDGGKRESYSRAQKLFKAKRRKKAKK